MSRFTIIALSIASLGALILVPAAYFIDRFRPSHRYRLAQFGLVCWGLILIASIYDRSWIWAAIFAYCCWQWLKRMTQYHPRPAHSTIALHPSSQKDHS